MQRQVTYSPDGQWWWDGRAWQPVPRPPAGRPGMFWFFSTPGWASPFVLTGLIAMIPFAGQMVLYGWYLATRDNLRQGWIALPRAGFSYLERGARPWVAALLYAVYAIPLAVILIVALFVAISTGSAIAIVATIVLLGLGWAGYSLLMGFLTGALIDLADSEGIGAAANPLRLWAVATAASRESWRVFGALFLGGLIYLGIMIVTAPFWIWIPFGSLALALLTPGIYLMAAPAQADFHRR